MKYHDLEQDLLREELNKRQNQLESAHSMLLRHHEMTQELETKQQRSVHGIREGQLTTQHRTELGNQVGGDSRQWKIWMSHSRFLPTGDLALIRPCR